MRTLVVGLGNVLMGDDGVGPHVVHLLDARLDPGPEVALLDAGTPGMDLTPHLHGIHALVVVDTVKSDGPPGALRLYRRADILAQAPLPRINPHQPGLQETLLLLDLAGAAPAEVLLVGVVPREVEMGTELSPDVRGAVPAALGEVIRELERLGHSVREREDARQPHLWWEAAAEGTGDRLQGTGDSRPVRGGVPSCTEEAACTASEG